MPAVAIIFFSTMACNPISRFSLEPRCFIPHGNRSIQRMPGVAFGSFRGTAAVIVYGFDTQYAEKHGEGVLPHLKEGDVIAEIDGCAVTGIYKASAPPGRVSRVQAFLEWPVEAAAKEVYVVRKDRVLRLTGPRLEQAERSERFPELLAYIARHRVYPAVVGVWSSTDNLYRCAIAEQTFNYELYCRGPSGRLRIEPIEVKPLNKDYALTWNEEPFLQLRALGTGMQFNLNPSASKTATGAMKDIHGQFFQRVEANPTRFLIEEDLGIAR